MAYLGAIGTAGANSPFHWYLIAWSRALIAEVILGDLIATYGSNSGYIYVG